MNGKYLLLAERIRNELVALESVVKRVAGILDRLSVSPADQDILLAAAALDLP